MAVTIKLKNASGSDPSASDLVVGEVALRTDSGKLFTKKDDNSIVQIGGGAGAIDDDAVTTAKIADGAVTNAKVASNAAIAGSKISPSFTDSITASGTGNASLILDAGTGGAGGNQISFIDLKIDGTVKGNIAINEGVTDIPLELNSASGTGPVHLFHASSLKLYTTSDGIESNGELHFKAPSSSTGEQVGRLEWWNENDAGVMAKIAVDRTATSNAPADLVFSTSANVDTTANGGDGDITERVRIKSDGTVDIGGNLDVGAGVDVTGDLTITSSLPKISLTDSGDNPDYEITNTNGSLNFKDTTNDATRISIQSSATTIANNLDCSAGIDCTGDLNVTGVIYLADQIRIGDDVFIEDYNAANSFRVKGNQDNNKGFIAFGSQTKQLGCNGASAALTYDGNEVLTSASTLTATNVVGVANTGNSEYRVPFLSADTGTAAVYTDTNSGMTYNPSTNTLSAVTFSGALSGNASTATKLANARTIAGVSFDGSANISLNNNAITNGAGYITATLTNEQVQDIVGGMVSGNSESGITVTYQDSDGTLDFSVASQTDQNFTTTLKNKLDGIASGATNVTNNNQLTNGAGYITSVSGQNYNSLSNLPTIPTNNNQLSNGAGYITSVSGQNYNSLSNKPTIPTNNNQLSNGAGYITAGSDRACQAWVNFAGDGTPSRRDNANVSSIGDNGQGNYTVSFTSSMPNSNYCVVIGFANSGNSNVAKVVEGSLSTSSFQLVCGSFQDGSGNNDRDFHSVYCAIFSD